VAKRDNVRNLLREGEDQPLVRGRGVAGMFDSPQAYLHTSPQVDEHTSTQEHLPTSPQAHQTTSTQAHKRASTQAHLHTSTLDHLTTSTQVDEHTSTQVDRVPRVSKSYRLPDEVVYAIELLAAQQRRPVGVLAEEALRDLLAKYDQPVD